MSGKRHKLSRKLSRVVTAQMPEELSSRMSAAACVRIREGIAHETAQLFPPATLREYIANKGEGLVVTPPNRGHSFDDSGTGSLQAVDGGSRGEHTGA